MEKFYEAIEDFIFWLLQIFDEYLNEIVTAIITTIICYIVWG